MSSKAARLDSRARVRAPQLATVIDAVSRHARECLRQQANAVAALGDRLDDRFTRAVHLIHDTHGHVVLLGLGKSGHVARKIAATLASTGTPSFFVHAAEALHGDLGMITADDTVILVSYSGSTAEIVQLLPHLQQRGVATIALVGAMGSKLATDADVALDVSVDRETCPYDLAPTSSTLVTAAMGDALAVAVMRLRGFHEEDFARVHPGGSLGRRLARVEDAAIRDGLVLVTPDTVLSEVVLALASADHAVALVRDADDEVIGMITPIELQRAMTGVEGALRAPARDVMSREVPTVEGETSVMLAEQRMETEDLAALLVLGADGRPIGLLPRPRRR